MEFSIQPVQRHPDIIGFTGAVVMLALAQSRPAKVKPQDRETKIIQRLHGVKNYFVVQRPPIKRMRMANQDSISGIRNTRIDKRFEPAGRALQK